MTATGPRSWFLTNSCAHMERNQSPSMSKTSSGWTPSNAARDQHRSSAHQPSIDHAVSGILEPYWKGVPTCRPGATERTVRGL